MDSAFSPRRLLRAIALASFTAMSGILPTPAIANIATAAVVPADPGPGGTAPVRPFRLDQIRLGKGLQQEKRDRIKHFLREYDERRFLMLFNDQAGRPNPEDVAVPGGWEDGGLLSGHWAGHYMSALSQAYADQGEQLYKEKLDWMVNELAACQKAITDRMDSAPSENSTRRDQRQVEDVGRVEGRFASALQLHETGSAQYVNLPQEAINQLRDFTIATWVHLNSTKPGSRLFDFGHDETKYMYLTPRAANSIDGAPRFAITTGGSNAEEQIDGDSALPTSEWVHIAVTLANGIGMLYVNGEVAGSNSGLTLNPNSLDNPGNRWIGRSQYKDVALNATLDEFHIFNRALSADEIQSLQDSASGSTGGGNIAWYKFDEEGGTLVEDSSPNGRDAGIVGEEDTGDHDWIPTHAGYLGALPEDTVLRLGPPRWAVYGGDANSNTWAPWYTLHKIMRGLLDAYYNTGNEQALEVVVKMADWSHLALTIGDKNNPDYKGNLTREDLNYMWDLYIAGEFGGANEVFPEIYELTGKAHHLETAKAFDNRASLFGAAVEDKDILVVRKEDNPGPRRPDRLHANTHIPQFIGYLRVYEHSSHGEYLDAARNFYNWIVPHREFSSGGMGGNYPGSNNNYELFQNRDNIANAIGESGAETCTTYNTLKLARNLFMHEQNASYMDHYERGFFNMILGSRADEDSADDPLVTYFQPLTPGSNRDYGNTGTCCGGTGLESHTKYQDTVYLRSADGSALWVNLYVPTTLTWEDKGIEVRQETDFPRSDKAKIIFRGEAQFDVKLRVPNWATAGFQVTINGEVVSFKDGPKPSSYVTIARTWKTDNVIEVSMPFSIRIERALDRPDTQSLMWGPVLLQLLGKPSGGAGEFRSLSLYKFLKLDGNYSAAAVKQTSESMNGDPLFTVAQQNLTVRPYYISDTQAVSSYFRRVEVDVVFGSINTGVKNRKRNDGLPNYDVPVEGFTSPGTDGPTFLDLLWEGAPFDTHTAFVDAVALLADSFVNERVYSKEERDTIVSTAQEAADELKPDSP